MTSAGVFLAVSLPTMKELTNSKLQILDSSKVADDNFKRRLVLQKGRKHKQFLAPLALGQRAYVIARCPSIRPLTFSLNIFFSETTYQMLMKLHRNLPAMVVFRIS